MNFAKPIVWLGTIVVFLFGMIPTVYTGEFRVGALNPLTGSGGPYGPGMLEAIKIVADEINTAGGILGNRVVVYSEDTQTEPETAVRAAKKLIEVHKMIGCYNWGRVKNASTPSSYWGNQGTCTVHLR